MTVANSQKPRLRLLARPQNAAQRATAERIGLTVRRNGAIVVNTYDGENGAASKRAARIAGWLEHAGIPVEWQYLNRGIAGIERFKPLATEDNPSGNAFLRSTEWRRVRYLALKRDGARCRCCGATPAHGAVMHVDHIKPRKTHPHLALDLNNLQVLCDACNEGKGNRDTTDWR